MASSAVSHDSPMRAPSGTSLPARARRSSPPQIVSCRLARSWIGPRRCAICSMLIPEISMYVIGAVFRRQKTPRHEIVSHDTAFLHSETGKMDGLLLDAVEQINGPQNRLPRLW